MMKRILILALLAVCPLLNTGCAYLLFPSTSRHLCFGEQPFHSTRKQTVVLQRPVTIVKPFTTQSNDTAEVLFAQTTNGIPAILPTGTEIKFDTFILHRDMAFLFIPRNIEYAAWFYVPALNLPKSVRFEYIWGRGRYLQRAPWEDESIPDRRYVGSNGKGYKKD